MVAETKNIRIELRDAYRPDDATSYGVRHSFEFNNPAARQALEFCQESKSVHKESSAGPKYRDSFSTSELGLDSERYDPAHLRFAQSILTQDISKDFVVNYPDESHAVDQAFLYADIQHVEYFLEHQHEPDLWLDNEGQKIATALVNILSLSQPRHKRKLLDLGFDVYRLSQIDFSVFSRPQVVDALSSQPYGCENMSVLDGLFIKCLFSSMMNGFGAVFESKDVFGAILAYGNSRPERVSFNLLQKLLTADVEKHDIKNFLFSETPRALKGTAAEKTPNGEPNTIVHLALQRWTPQPDKHVYGSFFAAAFNRGHPAARAFVEKALHGQLPPKLAEISAKTGYAWLAEPLVPGALRPHKVRGCIKEQRTAHRDFLADVRRTFKQFLTPPAQLPVEDLKTEKIENLIVNIPPAHQGALLIAIEGGESRGRDGLKLLYELEGERRQEFKPTPKQKEFKPFDAENMKKYVYAMASRGFQLPSISTLARFALISPSVAEMLIALSKDDRADPKIAALGLQSIVGFVKNYDDPFLYGDNLLTTPPNFRDDHNRKTYERLIQFLDAELNVKSTVTMVLAQKLAVSSYIIICELYNLVLSRHFSEETTFTRVIEVLDALIDHSGVVDEKKKPLVEAVFLYRTFESLDRSNQYGLLPLEALTKMCTTPHFTYGAPAFYYLWGRAFNLPDDLSPQNTDPKLTHEMKGVKPYLEALLTIAKGLNQFNLRAVGKLVAYVEFGERKHASYFRGKLQELDITHIVEQYFEERDQIESAPMPFAVVVLQTLALLGNEGALDFMMEQFFLGDEIIAKFIKEMIIDKNFANRGRIVLAAGKVIREGRSADFMRKAIEILYAGAKADAPGGWMEMANLAEELDEDSYHRDIVNKLLRLSPEPITDSRAEALEHYDDWLDGEIYYANDFSSTEEALANNLHALLSPNEKISFAYDRIEMIKRDREHEKLKKEMEEAIQKREKTEKAQRQSLGRSAVMDQLRQAMERATQNSHVNRANQLRDQIMRGLDPESPMDPSELGRKINELIELIKDAPEDQREEIINVLMPIIWHLAHIGYHAFALPAVMKLMDLVQNSSSPYPKVNAALSSLIFYAADVIIDFWHKQSFWPDCLFAKNVLMEIYKFTMPPEIFYDQALEQLERLKANNDPIFSQEIEHFLNETHSVTDAVE